MHSLLREYGWEFIRRTALPHPFKTAKAVFDACNLSFSKDATAISGNNPLGPLEGASSIVGVGFCMKPINPPCPSGRSNHDCVYLEKLHLRRESEIPAPCTQCSIRKIGIATLKAGAALYIMTSAKDILLDVFTPALDQGRFSSGVFLLCPYSLKPFSVGMLVSGIRGWLFPFEKGDCRDYKTWLLADIGIKDEQTEIIESKERMILRFLADSIRKTTQDMRFKKQGNIFYANTGIGESRCG